LAQELVVRADCLEQLHEDLVVGLGDVDVAEPVVRPAIRSADRVVQADSRRNRREAGAGERLQSHDVRIGLRAVR